MNDYSAFMNNKFLKYFAILACLFAVACGGSDDKSSKSTTEDARFAEQTDEQLYTTARSLFAKRKFTEAVEYFDEIERQFPYSKWANKSQIMAGYAHYSGEKYDDAILTFQRFVKLHPGNDSSAYAYYMIALSYYEQISDVGRDQGMTVAAEKSLNDVISRFPDSDYARDAKLKLDLTHDHLAGKEMMVGRYYLERDEYLSAANRFKTVIDDYQTTSHTPEALHRLVETYLKLGVRNEAKKYAAVLGHNFPNNQWYRYSYALLGEK